MFITKIEVAAGGLKLVLEGVRSFFELVFSWGCLEAKIHAAVS